MGFFHAVVELLSLVWMFFFKCIEYIFISLMFSVPIWLAYDNLIRLKFELVELHIAHIASFLFIFQLIVTLVIIAVNKNENNIAEMKNNNEDNKQIL